MATQLQQLPININNVINTVDQMKSKTFLVPQVPKIDIQPFLLTPRQIAKKSILIAGGVITSSGQVVTNIAGASQTTITSANVLGANLDQNAIPEAMSNYNVQFALNASQMIGQSITPESAHFAVYGKFKRDASGNLIDNEILDPDCVFQKLAMPDNHPTLTDIQVKVAKVLTVMKSLGIKEQDLLEDIAQSIMAIAASITAIASAVSIMPPGSGIPVAFSAFQGLMSNLINLISKVSGIAVDLEFLNYIPLIIQANKIDAIIGLLNAQLIAITVVLKTIDGLTKIIPSVPTPPGVGNQPGEPVTVEASAEPARKILNTQTDIKLSARASKGSWEYNYQWTGPNGFTSTDKEVTIKGGPFITTDYQVTVKDKKDSANSASATIRVEVVPA